MVPIYRFTVSLLTERRCLLATSLGLGLVLASSGGAQELSYNRDIRPILSKNCFACHGPDKAARKAKMRLDVPGKAETAPITERITSKDRREVMPPPNSGKSLTPAQIELLEAWASSGAAYEKHWAFDRPIRPRLPAGTAVPHPIDRFVRARLVAEGLEPSPPADRATLARRVHLDLLGLPPTPAEADAFVDDQRPDAYEKLVDRLLDSPRYGERWARRWLDLARYADTNGYEKDRNRTIWPYRDWVIRALNADMRFDQFTIEQLAGDMLPNATPSQRIATGFHRNTMLNEEGGIDPVEFRFHSMTDRVATTGTVFLGLTMGCAQCHTHKFDPITHGDYYEFMAFLNNADEPDYFIPDALKLAQHESDLAKAQDLVDQLPGKAQAARHGRVSVTLLSSTLRPSIRIHSSTVPWVSRIKTSSDVMRMNLFFGPIDPVSARPNPIGRLSADRCFPAIRERQATGRRGVQGHVLEEQVMADQLRHQRNR